MNLTPEEMDTRILQVIRSSVIPPSKRHITNRIVIDACGYCAVDKREAKAMPAAIGRRLRVLIDSGRVTETVIGSAHVYKACA